MNNELLPLLDALLERNAELQSLFEEEKNCLISNDLAGLRVVNFKEMELGSIIAGLEKRRMEVLGKLKRDLGIPVESIKLADICRYLPEQESHDCLSCGERIQKLLGRMMIVRKFNNALIEKMLAFNEKNIHLFMNIGNKKLTYDDQGKVQHSRRTMLDSRA